MGRSQDRNVAKRRRAIAPASGSAVSRRPSLVWAAVGLVGLALIAAAASTLWQSVPPPPPEIVLPEKLAELEPDVRRLVDRQVERTRAEPTSGLRHAELALIYEANEIWPAARDAYAAAIQLDPSQPLYRLHYAKAALESGDAAAYQERMKELAADTPRLAPIQQRWGQVCLESGDLAAAESAFEAVIEMEPKAAEGYAGLADVRIRQGDVDAAVTLLERAVQLDPSYRVAHFLLGGAYRQQGKLQEAARHLQLGQDAKVRYLPDDLSERATKFAVTVRGRHTRALKHLMARQFPEATELLEAALRVDPNHVPILNALAGTYMQTGKPEAALELLQRAKQLDDRDSTTYINLASWYLFHNQLDEAQRLADGAVERGPQVASAHRIRLDALLRSRKYEEAREAARQALEAVPQDVGIRQLATKLNVALP